MAYSRVLLVHPSSGAEWRGLTPHIGQAYLAQTLQQNGVEYDVLDLNLGYKTKHLLDKIKDFKPDLLGMSLISMGYKSYYQLISTLKYWNPKIKIVAGGPHVTILKEQVLRECPDIDYGVTFEGESTLLELSQGIIPQNEIKGLIWRNGREIVNNGDREFNIRLDTIPWPRYEKFEMKKYIPEMTIYSSRGCPHQCIFCPNKTDFSLLPTPESENVVDEMEYWYDRGYRQFNFDDDNFNFCVTASLKSVMK